MPAAGTHIQARPRWQTTLAKAAGVMEGRRLQRARAAMTQAAQRGHILGSTATFPLEVEQMANIEYSALF